MKELNLDDITITNLLKDLNLDNLIELDLSHNKINNIKFIANKNLPNLEKLNLSCNSIDDSNKPYFYELKCPELNDFNIFNNKLTEIDILKFKNKKDYLPELNIFFIGGNKFNFNVENIEKIKFDFSSVTEFGLSRGFFNQESIKYIDCFILTNLEYIYLSGNNIDNLNFVDNLDLPNIIEFWLNNNNISEFEKLSKYKTLKKIEMENNNIVNIENLDSFVNNFKNLQFLNLRGNNIKIDFISKSIIEIIRSWTIEILINPYKKD